MSLSGDLPGLALPVNLSRNFSSGAGRHRRTGGFIFCSHHHESESGLANTWTWFSEGDSSYNALQVDVNRRFSHGLTVRGVYTFAKVLDDGDSLNATTSGGGPALASNPFNLRSDWGRGTFDIRHVGVMNATYALPIGRGQRFLERSSGHRKWSDQRLDGQLHRDGSRWLPVFAATQLQPV